MKTEFLYASINDIQSTIRAIDAKISVLMVILIIPLSKLNSIYDVCSKLVKFDSGKFTFAFALLVIFFALFWFFSFWAAIKAIISIDNPVDHVDGDKPTGTFYCGHLYDTETDDAFTNRKIKSKKTLSEHQNSLPEDEDSLKKELAFEQMKLVYIRSMKLVRCKFAYSLGLWWIATGGAIWLLKLLLVK